MKRYGDLWDRLAGWENLVLAARRAQRNKRERASVQAFNFSQEAELLRLQYELSDQIYQPGGFASHWITQPKPRMISVAPYRDRVVHHALMNVLEPILDGHFHPDSYACRKNKGTLAAADRLQSLMRGHRYALQCDVRKFFPSIDHEILKGVFRRLIKDDRVLWLMDLIIDGSNEQEGPVHWFAGDDLFSPSERRRGLPIGNLTSQWFANWMLNDLDHYVTSRLGIGAYVRYCDDFILLHNDRIALKDNLAKVREHLGERRLLLHERKVFVRPVRAGLAFVGYRLWPTHRLLRKDNVHKFRRRVRWMKRAYAERRINGEDIKPRLASWMGYASHADSKRLVRRLSREWTFKRGGADRVSCASGRGVEQQRNQLHHDQPQQQHAHDAEQQLWVPSGPALSVDARHQARNRMVHGLCERGLESPGSTPVPVGLAIGTDGQMFDVEPDGTGRPRPTAPSGSWLYGVQRLAQQFKESAQSADKK